MLLVHSLLFDCVAILCGQGSVVTIYSIIMSGATKEITLLWMAQSIVQDPMQDKGTTYQCLFSE